MDQLCRFVWYDSGSVREHTPRRAALASTPSWPAVLRNLPDGSLVVSATIEGHTWNGRLSPTKPDKKVEGPAIVYRAALKD